MSFRSPLKALSVPSQCSKPWNACHFTQFCLFCFPSLRLEGGRVLVVGLVKCDTMYLTSWVPSLKYSIVTSGMQFLWTMCTGSSHVRHSFTTFFLLTFVKKLVNLETLTKIMVSLFTILHGHGILAKILLWSWQDFGKARKELAMDLGKGTMASNTGYVNVAH